MADNPIIIGALTAVLFTTLVLLSSFLTTYFMSYIDSENQYSGYFYISPTDVAKDIIRSALRILQDDDGGLLDLDSVLGSKSSTSSTFKKDNLPPPGLLKRFVQRFIIGLPMIGAGSLVHMALSVPFLGPMQWIARYRGNNRGDRRGRNRGTDVAAILLLTLVFVGAARAIYKVYGLTQRAIQRLMLRAEDAILEVN